MIFRKLTWLMFLVIGVDKNSPAEQYREGFTRVHAVFNTR